jgi:hypothetical protein
MAKNPTSGDFTLIIDQDGRKMAFSSREISHIKFDGDKLHIKLKEPKYQIPYLKYLSLLRQGVDPVIKEMIMNGVRTGRISIV